jgi:hypothetical protein
MDKLENTRSHVRCICSMCQSFWPLIRKQVVILTAMSNYFLSYTQIIGPWPMTEAKRKPCIILVSNLKEISPSVFSWKKKIYKKLRCNSTVKIWFGRKKIKRLLHDIFHIGPGISLRLPYQARQRSWRADMGRGLIPGTI